MNSEEDNRSTAEGVLNPCRTPASSHAVERAEDYDPNIALSSRLDCGNHRCPRRASSESDALKQRWRAIVAALLPWLALSACVAPDYQSSDIPLALITSTTAVEAEGLSNTWRLSSDLYRGAQPEADGFRELQRLGVNTVINLRQFHSDRDEMEDAKLKDEFDYAHIRIATWSPSEAQVLEFLKVATDPKRRPVFVHCMHGADRTGMMIAAYRIVVEGWSKDEAIAEMTVGGFGYHSMWTGLPELLRELDVESLRQELGISAPEDVVKTTR